MLITDLSVYESRVISSSLREVMGNDYGGVALFDHEVGQLHSFMMDAPPGQPLREAGYQSRPRHSGRGFKP